MVAVVNLNAFMWAFEKAAEKSVSPDSWVWQDLGLFGDDWWVFSVRLMEYLTANYQPAPDHWDIYDFIPLENEVSVLGKGYIGKRELPDIQIREVYGHVSEHLVLTE